MRKILLLARNDLRLTFRDKSSVIWMLMLPLAMMWFFGGVFENTGINEQPRISLSVVNYDDGWLSGAFIEDLESDKINLRVFTPKEAADATDKVRTLVIPAGFTEQVLAGEQQELRLEKEPGASDTYSLAAQVHILRTIVRTLGRLVEINPAEGSGFGDSSIGMAIDTLIEEMNLLANPRGDAEGETDPAETFEKLAGRERLVGLSVATAGSGTPVPSGTAQSVPGILTMSVLMMTVIYGGVFLTTEKRDGTLRRQLTLPVNRAHVFVGKLLGRLYLALLQIAVLLLAGRFLFGLTYENAVTGLLVLMFCFAVAAAGLATLLGALLRTPEQAGSLGWLICMAMAALGGCWWPSEIMPRWLWTAAHILPTAWAMVLPGAVLLGFGLLFSLLGSRFLKTAGI